MNNKEIEYTKIIEEYDSTFKEFVLRSYVKKIRDNYDVEDIVRKHDGNWIVILKYNSLKKLER